MPNRQSQIIVVLRMTNKVVAIFAKQLTVTVTPDSDPESILFRKRF